MKNELLPEESRYISEEEANRIHAGADLPDDSFDEAWTNEEKRNYQSYQSNQHCRYCAGPFIAYESRDFCSKSCENAHDEMIKRELNYLKKQEESK